MKASMRDDLLIRLDERSESIMRELVSLNEHQVEQNGYIKTASERSAKNSTWITAFRYIMSIAFPVIALVLTRLYGLW